MISKKLILAVLSIFTGALIFLSSCSGGGLAQSGSYIFFYTMYDDSSTPNIMVTKIENGQIERNEILVPGGFSFVLSPDGGSMAYVKKEEDQRDSVFVMDTDGGSENLVFRGEDLEVLDWKDEIILVKKENLTLGILHPKKLDRLGSGQHNLELYLVKTDGSLANTIFSANFENSTFFSYVGWCEDLNELFYIRGSGFRSTIYSVDMGQGTETVFVENVGLFGVMDECERIFYTVPTISHTLLKLKSIDGSIENTIRTCDQLCRGLNWMDGILTFVEGDTISSRIVEMWEEDGSWKSRIVIQGEDIIKAWLSYDGKLVLYLRGTETSGVYELWLAKADGTGNPVLVNTGRIENVCWKP